MNHRVGSDSAHCTPIVNNSRPSGQYGEILKSRDLLLAVTRCPELNRATSSSHPCHKIVSCQNNIDVFQLPEPWTGNLSSAPILFVSSNPSINKDEAYPTKSKSWSEDEVVDFFENRFESNRIWTRASPSQARYVLLKDRKSYHDDWVRFWSSARKRSEELLDHAPVPGRDYALTEVVHCKSEDEEGVSESISICSQKWIEPILEHSNAKIVVLVGALARDVCSDIWNIDNSQSVHFNVLAGHRPRAVVILPHPNARNVPKKISDYATEEQIRKLRSLLSK